MKKIELILIVFFIVATAGAKIIEVPEIQAKMNLWVISGAQTNTAGETIVFDEKFEGTGYEESGWSETVGGGATVDEDADTSDVSSPAGWGSQCLKIVAPENTDAFVAQERSSLSDSWLRIEVVIASHSISSGNHGLLLIVWDFDYSDVYTLRTVNIGGTLYFQIAVYHDGTENEYTSLNSISLDTRYRIEVKWDVTNDVWAWRIDGADQPNDQDASDPVTSEGILTDTHATNLANFRVGGVAFGAYSSSAMTSYIDLIAIDGAGWVGAEG